MSLIASGRMRVEDAIRADEYKDIARVHWEYRGKPTTKVGSIIKLRVPDRPSRILSIRGLADDRKGQILLDHVNRNEMGLNLGEEYEFTIETTNAWDKLKWACTSTDPAARIAAWIAIIFGVLAALGLLVALIGLYPVLREIGAGRDSHSPAPRSDVVEALNPLAIVVSPAYIFGLAAALCIVAAVIQACRNRIKSGWLLGTLFLYVQYLPIFHN